MVASVGDFKGWATHSTSLLANKIYFCSVHFPSSSGLDASVANSCSLSSCSLCYFIHKYAPHWGWPGPTMPGLSLPSQLMASVPRLLHCEQSHFLLLQLLHLATSTWTDHGKSFLSAGNRSKDMYWWKYVFVYLTVPRILFLITTSFRISHHPFSSPALAALPPQPQS